MATPWSSSSSRRRVTVDSPEPDRSSRTPVPRASSAATAHLRGHRWRVPVSTPSPCRSSSAEPGQDHGSRSRATRSAPRTAVRSVVPCSVAARLHLHGPGRTPERPERDVPARRPTLFDGLCSSLRLHRHLSQTPLLEVSLPMRIPSSRTCSNSVNTVSLRSCGSAIARRRHSRPRSRLPTRCLIASSSRRHRHDANRNCSTARP